MKTWPKFKVIKTAESVWQVYGLKSVDHTRDEATYERLPRGEIVLFKTEHAAEAWATNQSTIDLGPIDRGYNPLRK